MKIVMMKNVNKTENVKNFSPFHIAGVITIDVYPSSGYVNL